MGRHDSVITHWNHLKAKVSAFNAKLFHYNFHPLEVSEKYSDFVTF